METENFNFKTIVDRIDEWMSTDIIDPADIPSIELYMDQVTTFMDKELSGTKRHADDKILTKTMINNYSKNNLLPPSDKKKYSKDHIILLIYIYYMKNFLSINDIQTLLQPMTDKHFASTATETEGTKPSITMADIYSDIVTLEQKYKIKLKENIYDICKMAENDFSEDSEYLKIFAMIAMLSYDIYTKKQLIEQLIDSISNKDNDKSSEKSNDKKEKEQRKQMEKQAKAAAKNKDKS